MRFSMWLHTPTKHLRDGKKKNLNPVEKNSLHRLNVFVFHPPPSFLSKWKKKS